MVEKLKLQWFRDALSVMHQISEVHDAEATWGTLVQAKETLANKMIEWQARLGEIHSRNQEFEEQVAIAEQKLIAAQMDTSCAEALEGLKEEQALLLAREKQMETDLKDLEDCLEAIEDQLLSIKMQKETLEKPDPDEAFLKNELSLFLNVSSILPDLGDPKFSGTFVDKQKGVKAFKFSADSMSPFEICQAAWDMMK